MENQKETKGKLRYDLVPFYALDLMAEVMTIGAEKYEPSNWLTDSEIIDIKKYEAAALRHISRHMQGEYLDAESGLPHMAHVACNAMFVMELRRKHELV